MFVVMCLSWCGNGVEKVWQEVWKKFPKSQTTPLTIGNAQSEPLGPSKRRNPETKSWCRRSAFSLYHRFISEAVALALTAPKETGIIASPKTSGV
jgi:hypothetical protein